MTSTRLVLVRHGRTEWNHTGRFQGQADIALDDTGRAQAAATAVRVAAMRPDALYSSDLLRARETAEALGAAAGLPVRSKPELQEINVGTWSGLTMAEAALEFPDMTRLLREGRDFRRSATGETATEAGARVTAALTELAHSHAGGCVAAVSHGLVLRISVLNLLGLDLVAGRSFAGLWNGSWTVLEHTDRWRLLSYNNVADA